MKKIKKIQIKEVIREIECDDYRTIYKNLIILNYKRKRYKYEKKIYDSKSDDDIIGSNIVDESIQQYVNKNITTKNMYYFINDLETTLSKDDNLYWFFEPNEADFTNIDDKEIKSLINKIFIFPIKTYKEANLIYEVLNG